MVNQLNVVSEEEAYAQQIPYSHWIMMGLNSGGGFNRDDVLYTQSFPNIDEKKAATVSEIKKRLSNYGFTGLINHLTNKAVLIIYLGKVAHNRKQTQNCGILYFLTGNIMISFTTTAKDFI